MNAKARRRMLHQTIAPIADPAFRYLIHNKYNTTDHPRVYIHYSTPQQRIFQFSVAPSQ